MSEHDDETGRRAVRTHLIEPLEAEGLRRGRRETVEAHKAFLTEVAKKLGYMRQENLVLLRPILRSLATGAALDVWPSLATILNHAYRIQPPPDRSDDILWSWLHSVEGPKLRAAGMLLATRAFIKKYRRPPLGDFVMKGIREDQRALDAMLEEWRRKRGLGEATDSELAGLARYEQILAGLEAIVDAGVRHRAAKEVAA